MIHRQDILHASQMHPGLVTLVEVSASVGVCECAREYLTDCADEFAQYDAADNFLYGFTLGVVTAHYKNSRPHRRTHRPTTNRNQPCINSHSTSSSFSCLFWGMIFYAIERVI